MSINLVRSPRKTEFWQRQTTPQAVGPGIYDADSNQKEVIQNVAPFNSLKERKINESNNENPGPGTYVEVPEASRPESRPSNAFATKIPRFCPTAPGSTVFKPPSSILNPGPGTYYQQPKWNEPKSLTKIQERYNTFQHKDLSVKPQGRAPSIPAKKIATNAYSGLGQDTVGPACYNPLEISVKQKNRLADFTSNKIPRKVFEPNITRENNLPSKENPGPGTYELQQIVVNEKKNFNSQGQSAIFLSKVPNCKDMKNREKDLPGPGYYDNKEIAASASAAEHKKNNSQINGNSSINGALSLSQQTNTNFLSTTKREDYWYNELNAPFTKATNLQNPGPGKYNLDKKKDDIKSKILIEQTVHIPFSSSVERDCNRKGGPKGPPGPGTYIDINNPQNSSVTKPLLKFSSDRTFAEAHGIKLGGFGSNQKRFEKGVFDKKSEVPGPGFYEKIPQAENMESKDVSRIDQKPATKTAFFKSTTDRFSKIDNQNPNIRILESQGNQRKGGTTVYNKSTLNISGTSTRAGTQGSGGVISYLHKGPNWTHQMRATDYEAFAGKRVGFDATSPRFTYNNVFYGQSLKFEVPGPGAYQEVDEAGRPKTYSQPRSKHIKYSVVFNTCEKRFKNKGQNSYVYQGGTAHGVGPGSYISNENSMIKKSFNMSMEHSYFL